MLIFIFLLLNTFVVIQDNKRETVTLSRNTKVYLSNQPEGMERKANMTQSTYVQSIDWSSRSVKKKKRKNRYAFKAKQYAVNSFKFGIKINFNKMGREHFAIRIRHIFKELFYHYLSQLLVWHQRFFPPDQPRQLPLPICACRCCCSASCTFPHHLTCTAFLIRNSSANLHSYLSHCTSIFS